MNESHPGKVCDLCSLAYPGAACIVGGADKCLRDGRYTKYQPQRAEQKIPTLVPDITDRNGAFLHIGDEIQYKWTGREFRGVIRFGQFTQDFSDEGDLPIQYLGFYIERIAWSPKKELNTKNFICAQERTVSICEAEDIEFCSHGGNKEATQDKLSATLPKAVEPANTGALTVEQLRKMDSDMENRCWVWIEVLKPFSYELKVSAYYQVQYDYTKGKAFICGYPGLTFGFDYSDYGKTWLAYRCKPELDCAMARIKRTPRETTGG